MAGIVQDLGRDLSCVTDIDPRFVEVTGRRLVAEAIVRRLITPRGRLLDDPNYGTDIREWINEDFSQSDIASLGAAIRAECEKDERVSVADVAVTAPPSGTGAYTIEITLTDGDGPFDLVLEVTDVTVKLLTVSP